MNYAEEPLKPHYELKGKLEITARAPVDTQRPWPWPIPRAWRSPAWRSRRMSKSYELTLPVEHGGRGHRRHRRVGSGDIGPEAGMPVMEGKCVLLSSSAAWTLCPQACAAKRWTTL